MRVVWVSLGWLMVVAIVWLSLTPSPPRVDVPEGDKLGHFLAYGALMFWFCQLYVRRGARIGYAAGFVTLGVALEFVQGALGYRAYEVADMYANTLGVLTGWAACLKIPRFLPGAETGTRSRAH